MFSGFFNYDNPVWRFIGKFWDVILLSVLWTVCSLPIVTIGASTTAMYYVTLKLVRDEDGYTIRSFFKSFRENFKQSTIIWLIFLAVGIILGVDLYFFIRMFDGSQTVRMVMTSVFAALTFVYLAMFTYVFPLQARFYNPIKRTIFNAFFMSIRHLLYTIGMLAVDVALVVLAVIAVPQILLFGIALFAFVNSYMLAAVFRRYMPAERTPDDELRPLFAEDDLPKEAAPSIEEVSTGEDTLEKENEKELAEE